MDMKFQAETSWCASHVTREMPQEEFLVSKPANLCITEVKRPAILMDDIFNKEK